MAKVKVLIEHLVHNGKRCKPGQLIDIDSPDQLLALGAVELVKEPAKPKESAKPKEPAK